MSVSPIDRDMDPTAVALGELLREQLEEWPLARDNYEALGHVRVKSLLVGGMPFKVQFNPARIVSSGANVGAAAVKARPCFLCGSNRPVQQRGLPWCGYTVLVNPFPIFPRHFTIPLDSHEDQRICGRVSAMMRLAAALDGYTVFYNGPRCGASAPDHMHFQAGNTGFLTLPGTLDRMKLKEVARIGGAVLSTAPELPFGVFVIDTQDIPSADTLFCRLYDALPVLHPGEESMMNLLCYGCGDHLRLVVIPRRRHRPSCYGTDGAGQMLVSPASVDIGGVFITPLEKDFEAIDAARIRAILDEVCMSQDQIDGIACAVGSVTVDNS